jgi:hypothetical protein
MSRQAVAAAGQHVSHGREVMRMLAGGVGFAREITPIGA